MDMQFYYQFGLGIIIGSLMQTRMQRKDGSRNMEAKAQSTFIYQPVAICIFCDVIE